MSKKYRTYNSFAYTEVPKISGFGEIQFLFGAKVCRSDRNMFLMLHDSLEHS
ncbi:MAG: hypothetical protein ACKPCM_12555 [Pseudanabaena sp.]